MGQRSNVCFMSASPTQNYNDEVRWSGSFAMNATVSPYPRSYNYGPYGATPKDMQTVGVLRVDKISDADDKKAARLNLIAHLLSCVPYQAIPREPVVLPPRQKRSYMRPPIDSQTWIPTRYILR